MKAFFEKYYDLTEKVSIKTLRKRIRKAEALEMYGGCCQCCGYEFNRENIRYAHFHHTDSTTKNGNMKDAFTWSSTAYIEELEKCVLLCDMCHSALHQSIGNECTTDETLAFIESKRKDLQKIFE